jgi:hypothetical protein
MNYIKQLETKNRATEVELAALKAGITELIQYLNSPKFFPVSGPTSELDGYVNVNDVLRRLSEASIASQDAWFEVAGPLLRRA